MFTIQMPTLTVLSAMAVGLGISQGALADPCDGFVDVDSAASYCAAVTYVKNRGVTLGCTDSTHYCPNDNVTRAQMALYLQRMGKADPSNTLGDNTTAIGGGIGNSATGGYSVVAGGESNSASNGLATVSGGYGNTADGYSATVLGGRGNTATGGASIAAGLYANANQDQCAVFSLWSGSLGLSCLGYGNVFRIGADHGFSVDYHTERDDGGGTRWVALGDTIAGQTIATWNGAYLSDGGTWTNASDRAAKENFKDIDPTDVLARVAAMPITRWQYKRDPAVTHLGPVAQDFRAAFGLGLNDTSISTVDEEGVALAAIQGLNAKLEAVTAQLAAVMQLLAAKEASAPAAAATVQRAAATER